MTTELTKVAQQALEALTTLHNVYAAMRLTLYEKYPDDGWSAETMTLDQAKAAITDLERALTQRPAVQEVCAHVLYTTQDTDRPDAICDRNGEVVLSMCKLCGKAESELPSPQQATPEPEWETSPPDGETWETSPMDGEQWETTPMAKATPEPVEVVLQGGLNNDALLNAWRSKLPGVTPTDAQMTAFALGVEVGFAHARTLERSDWSRVHEVLKKAGVHPGRTDDHLADVIAKALSTRPAPGVPEGLPAVLTDWGFDVHDDEEGRTWLTIRNPDDDVARMSVPTVWPLNGNQTISAVVLHQFSAALTSALAAVQAKGGEHG